MNRSCEGSALPIFLWTLNGLLHICFCFAFFKDGTDTQELDAVESNVQGL